MRTTQISVAPLYYNKAPGFLPGAFSFAWIQGPGLSFLGPLKSLDQEGRGHFIGRGLLPFLVAIAAPGGGPWPVRSLSASLQVPAVPATRPCFWLYTFP